MRMRSHCGAGMPRDQGEHMQSDIVEERKASVKPHARKPIRLLIALALGGAVLATYMAVSFTRESTVQCDFISYWAAGHLLKNGQNPYDAKAVFDLEAKVGRDPHVALLIMRNPPLAFPMVLPFGWIGPKAGLIAWTLLLIYLVVLASWLLWVLYGRPDSLLRYLGFGFPPIVACLMARQTGILLLLGITLFFILWKDRPFLAGASLWLCALKPHLFVPFGIALFLWCFTNKKGYRILAGFAVALLASCALAFAMDQHAWAQYAELIRTGGPLNEIVPSLSAQLRLVTNPHAVWIQFLPMAAACFWAIWYFWTRRQSWDWMDHGQMLLLVGAVTVPYGFVYDQSMLLPAVLAGAYRCIESSRPTWPLGLFAGVGVLELNIPIQIVSPYYLWTAPAWLCWYLYATGRFSRRPSAAAH